MANLSPDCNQLPYWVDVRNEVTAIQVAVTKQNLQPLDGSYVYITSLKRRNMPEFKEGVVQIALPKRAAECIVSETHRLSTDSEIEAYLEKGKADKKAAEAAENKAKGNIIFGQPRPA